VKVCFFGSYTKDPAIDLFKKKLELQKIEVKECHVDIDISLEHKSLSSVISSFWKLLVKHSKVGSYDIAILPFWWGAIQLPLLKIISRKPILYYASAPYDELVHDRKKIKPTSFTARFFFFFERMVCRFSDLIIKESLAEINYFTNQMHIEKKKFRVLIIGADESKFPSCPFKETKEKFVVLYFGTFIPLHGVEVIIEAAKILERDSDIVFRFFGDGQTRDLKRRQVRKFVNKNFLKKIDDKTNFIYYPLHSEPERALSIAAPYYTNQIEIITHIAKSIPVGYKVYVKDHPIMDVKGGRNIKFYKEIMKLPNVQLFHPSLSQDELIMKCSLVVTVAGTGGMEAAIYGKPSIILTDTLYSSLPSVTKLQNLEDLPNVIRAALQKKVNPADMKDFIAFIDKHSFQVDKQSVVSELRMRFYQKKIQEKEMVSFLEDFRPELEIFSSEYIKKIKMLSNQKNQIKR